MEDEVKANYENGVLKLNIAKVAVNSPKAKEIPIL
jgi:HSP20 family molecular chaperone IbpA